MGKAKKNKDYRFMLGVLDSRTHSNIFYLKNLDLKGFDAAVQEVRKKFK